MMRLLTACRFALLSVVAATATLVSAGARAQDNPFVCPTSLEPAVAFWKRVYTEVGTSGGFIHDDEHLEVVYSVLEFAPGTPQATRSKRIEDEKKRVVAVLRKLARGDADLSAAEQKIRDAWPIATANGEFANAAERVRFQLGQADRFREGLVRSGAYLPEIRKTFAGLGLPVELAALPHVESSFNTYAYSKVGAAGMWQFMRSTGRRYLRIDNAVDERLDPYKATLAAANFLQQNYAVLQSWPLAVTAYNHGAGGMLRAKQQLGTDDIGAIVDRYDGKTFGFASRNFYAAFLAALDIDSAPDRYFPGVIRAAPDSSEVLFVKSATSLPSLMKSLKVDSSMLKQLNPSLLPAAWNGRKPLPAGFALRVPSPLDSAPAWVSTVPVSAPPIAIAKTHRVKKGETFAAIAKRYGVSTQRLAQLNGLRKPYRLTPGKMLKLPVEPTPVYAATQPAATVPVTATPAITAETALVNALDATVLNESDEPVATPASERPEPKSVGEAEALGPTLVPGVQAAGSADPADYSIHDGNMVFVEASESVARYAEWLNVTSATLRKINKLKSSGEPAIGRPFILDLSKVDAATFEAQRTAYHQQLQESFFAQFRIVGSDPHVMRKGESIWELSEKIYSVPIWLLRQYNPDVDLTDLKPGTKLVIPRVLQVSPGSGDTA